MNSKDRMLLAELLGVVVDMLDAPGDSDLVGRVRAWCDVAQGRVQPGDRFWTYTELLGRQARPMPTDQRRMTAVRLAKERGAVTSTDLSQCCNVGQEAARRDLAELALAGVLTAKGDKRGRCYMLPSRGVTNAQA